MFAWAVMMAAMMLPSALPMIGLYAAAQRNATGAAARAAAVVAFATMYLAVWAASGVPIYFAALALMAVTPVTLAYATAGVLVGAGAFQLSPLKPDSGQEFVESGAISVLVAAAGRVLECEHLRDPVMDGGRDLHQEAALGAARRIEQLLGVTPGMYSSAAYVPIRHLFPHLGR